MSDTNGGFQGIGRDRGHTAIRRRRIAPQGEDHQRPEPRKLAGPPGPHKDPYDIDGAFSRLRTLLAFDGENGPRPNVPLRAFYLNILV